MKRLLIFIFYFISFSQVAYSCKCPVFGGDYSNWELTIDWYNSTPFIFSARIDSVNSKDIYRQLIYVTTLTNYKGELKNTLTISTPAPFRCGGFWDNEIDSVYIFYAFDGTNGLLVTNNCSGTKPIREIKSQELNLLSSLTNAKNDSIKTYYSNGKLTGEGKFENGEPSGHWKYFTFNGKKNAEGDFKDGMQNGEWKEYVYKSNWKRVAFYSIGNYSKGFKNGDWKQYQANGKYLNTYTYENGRMKFPLQVQPL